MKNATQFHIRPARPEEAGLFYTQHPEEDKRLGTVGHVRMDFGRSGRGRGCCKQKRLDPFESSRLIGRQAGIWII